MGILCNVEYVKAAQKKKEKVRGKKVMKLMGFKSTIEIFWKKKKKKISIKTNKLGSSTLCSKDGDKHKNTIWWKLDCISSL